MCISVSSETVVESKQKIQIRVGASSTLAPSVQWHKPNLFLQSIWLPDSYYNYYTTVKSYVHTKSNDSSSARK